MTSTDLYESGDTEYTWKLEDCLYITAEAVVGFLTIVVNSLVFAALYRYRHLRTVTNVYVGSLVVADILVGFLVAPLAGVVYVGLPKDFYACVLLNCLLNCFINVSVLSLVCVAFERHLAVRHPMLHMRFGTKSLAYMVVVAVWILGTLMGMIPFLGLYNDPEGFTICTYRRAISLHYSVYVQFFGLLLPVLLIMLVFYVRMCSAFRKAEYLRLQTITGKQSLVKALKQPSLKEKRLFKSLALIFTLFFVCFLPLFVLNCIRFWSPATFVPASLVLFTVVLSHINSCINPVIYALNQKGFREVIGRHAPVWLSRIMGVKLKKPTVYPVSEVPSTGIRRSMTIIALKDIASSGPNEPADRELQKATVVSFLGLEGTSYITTDCLPSSSAVSVKTVCSSPDVQHQEEGTVKRTRIQAARRHKR